MYCLYLATVSLVYNSICMHYYAVSLPLHVNIVLQYSVFANVIFAYLVIISHVFGFHTLWYSYAFGILAFSIVQSTNLTLLCITIVCLRR